MTIDFWGLGLQAVNVLILVWLLSRVFWRPVAAAIARRQDTANKVLETAAAAQAKADEALEEATKARAEAETATKAAMAEARTKADTLLANAKATIAKDAEAARKANESQAADLSLTIAARLLERLNGPAVQSVFLSQLVEAIEKMSDADRAALVADPKGIEIVTATDPGADEEKIVNAVHAALGDTPKLSFVTEPDLIAGLELRSPHFVLHNSWQADLAQVQKAVQDAA
jgi:F-type H+-transporting ATPase subunit b